jgi:hypothetical protein
MTTDADNEDAPTSFKASKFCFPAAVPVVVGTKVDSVAAAAANVAFPGAVPAVVVPEVE